MVLRVSEIERIGVRPMPSDWELIDGLCTGRWTVVTWDGMSQMGRLGRHW